MSEGLSILVLGIRDGWNVCHLSIAGIVALFAFFLFRTKQALASFAIAFLLPYLMTSTILHLGFMNEIIASYSYSVAVMVVGLILGAVFLYFGFKFLLQWRRYLHGDVLSLKVVRWWPVLTSPMGVVLGIAAAFFTIFWPPDTYLLVWAQQFIIPGRLWPSFSIMLCYEFLRLMATYLVLLIFGLAFFMPRLTAEMEARRSLICIIIAALYLSLGGCLFYFFAPA